MHPRYHSTNKLFLPQRLEREFTTTFQKGRILQRRGAKESIAWERKGRKGADASLLSMAEVPYRSLPIGRSPALASDLVIP